MTPDGAKRSCQRAAGRVSAASEPTKARRTQDDACVFYEEPNFHGPAFVLKAEKPGRGVVYGDATRLPAALSGRVASVSCAPGCSFFAHDRDDHEGEEYKGGAGASLPELGAWTARIRSAGLACKI
jgi:hypothetical protein